MPAVFWSSVLLLIFLFNVTNMLINFSEWLLMGQEAGNSDDDKKHVFPLTQKQIEELKYHVESDLFDSPSPSVGSGWKLR
jgi:hypothetical protein